MDNETQEERAKRRKRERKQREMEYQLSRDLKLEQDTREMEEIENQYRNKYVDKAILFFSTLGLSYLILFIVNYLFTFLFGGALALMGVSLAFLYPFFHAVIWIMAILSVYRGRSVLDDITRRFF